MTYWFTADCHFGHNNIREYCNRPFSDISTMNAVLIKNWVDTVGKDDTVFHIGDFSFMNKQATEDLLAQLPGRIVFLKGNHEGHPKTVTESAIIRYEGHSVHLNHYAERANPFMLSLVGHVHDKWKIQYHMNEDGTKGFPIVNVGVDMWDFKPVDFETIIKFVRNNSSGW